MTMPTTPFFPTHLQPLYGASESPSLPIISTELTSQRIQRRSRGLTHKRVWKLTFKNTPGVLIDLQKHWESVDGDSFPFVSPISRRWSDIPAVPATGGSPLYYAGMIGGSASVDYDTASDFFTEAGEYDPAEPAYAITAGHNLLPAGAADGSNSALMDTQGCSIGASSGADSLARSRIGGSSFFVITNGGATNEYIYNAFGSRAVASPGLSYTGSCYLTGSGTVGVKLEFFDSGAGATGITAQTAVVLDNTWQRVSVSGTAPGSTDRASLRIGTTSLQTVAFWADGLQIEAGGDLKSWCYPGHGYTSIYLVDGTVPALWQSASGGRIHVVKYVGTSMPIARAGYDIETISIDLEEDLGGY
jgi:hypothetical protein